MSAKKILLGLFGLFVVGAIGIAVVLAIWIPRLVEERVVLEAKQRGFALVPGEISYGMGWVQIEDSRLSLIGVRGLDAEVGLIDVELDGFVPLRFSVTRVKARAVGDIVTLSRDLAAWDKAHSGDLKEPVAIRELGFSLADTAQSPPRATLEGGTARAEGGRAFLEVKRAVVLGKNLGELRAIRQKETIRVDVTLGQTSLENPLVTFETADRADRTLHVGVSPIRLQALGQVLGVALPLPEVLASGTFDATVPRNLLVGGRVSGRADVLLQGYVPPHPVELDGFVFGDTTTFGAEFTLEPELLRVRLENAGVKAGKFELKGGGQLALEGDHGRLSLLLRGQLPCADLAGAAAESRLGRALGRVTGKAARQVLQGMVQIAVSIDAETNALDKARVLRTISPGCGLKPLTLEELIRLGELVPEALDPRVFQDFQKLVDNGFPALPGVTPGFKLPTLNGLPFPVLPGIGATPATPRASGAGGSGR